jgi:hypothetical protein
MTEKDIVEQIEFVKNFELIKQVKDWFSNILNKNQNERLWKR